MSAGVTIQFYRGAAAGIPTLADGEPGWTTDTFQLYVGEGGANHLVGGSLPDPVTVAHGGTGDTTLVNHGVLLGQGTAAVAATAVGATNNVLHGNTGADPTFSAVVEADLGLTNITTADVSTSAHGFAPKLPNDATKYLDGTGAYTVPTGGGGASVLTTKGDIWAYSSVDARFPVGANNTTILADSSQALGIKWGAYPTVSIGAAGLCTALPGSSLFNRFLKDNASWTSIDVKILDPGAATPADGKVLTADAASTYGMKWATAGGTQNVIPLFDHYADAGNVALTGDTDLYSDTIAAGQLANNGEKLETEYAGVVNTTGSSLRVWFAGTKIFDSGSLSVSGAGSFDVWVTIIRESSSVVRTIVTVQANGFSSGDVAYNRLTGLTLSGTNILKLTSPGGTIASDNDVVAKFGSVRWIAKA